MLVKCKLKAFEIKSDHYQGRLQLHPFLSQLQSLLNKELLYFLASSRGGRRGLFTCCWLENKESQLESSLLTHPSQLESSIFMLPHPRRLPWGQIPNCFNYNRNTQRTAAFGETAIFVWIFLNFWRNILSKNGQFPWIETTVNIHLLS